MAQTEPIRTGWEPGCPPEDTLARAALWNMAERLRVHTAALGGRFEQDDALVLCDARSPCPYLNMAVALQPLTAEDGEPLDRIAAFFGPDHPGWIVTSPWPLPDGTLRRGRSLLGYSPFMVRSPGGEPPAPPPELEVEEATTAASLADAERTLAEGFPIEALGGAAAGCLFRPGAVEPARVFVGRVDGRPVSVAVGTPAHGVSQVEFVATLPGARGRGYGEAVTWAATLVDPAAPATLLASDLGRPVYERMGYLAVARWALLFARR